MGSERLRRLVMGSLGQLQVSSSILTRTPTSLKAVILQQLLRGSASPAQWVESFLNQDVKTDAGVTLR